MASNIANIKSLLNKALQFEKKRFSEYLIKEFQTTFVTDYVAAFSRVYDQTLMSGGSLPEDPTSPENIKSEVLSTVRSRIEEAVGRLTYTGGDIHIQGLSPADLGFLGSGNTISAAFKDPPKQFLFAFYIVGMISDVVFISKSTYKKISGRDAHLGRFGQGYLMDGAKYRKMLSGRKAMGANKNSLPAYEEVLHPFSGRGPINFFSILKNYIDLGKYVKAAARKMRTK